METPGHAATPVLELGDDRVFVRPLDHAEHAAIVADIAEPTVLARVLLAFAVMLAGWLWLLPSVGLALVSAGLLAGSAVLWRRVHERRRDLADGVLLEVRSARRKLRVLARSGRVLGADGQVLDRGAE